MRLGRRLYFDLVGNFLADRGELSDGAVDTTMEQDFASFSNLAGRTVESVIVKQLLVDDYAQDFATCNGVKLNIQTGTLEFTYPGSTPQEPPVYQVPLTEQVAELKSQNSEIILTLVMNDLM